MTDPDDSTGRIPTDLDHLATVLEEAAQESSRYRMAAVGREKLGVPWIGELPEDLPVAVRATAWAMEYHVETVDKDGRRRIELVPNHRVGSNTHPPLPRDVPEQVVEVWRALSGQVRQAPARARLHHLLFERGAPDRLNHARAAVDAYLASAQGWRRELDGVHDLAAATRLARAIGDRQSSQESLDRMLDLAERHLGVEDPPAGIIMRALDHVAGEPGCPDRVDELLERAAAAWPDANRKDDALKVMLSRCRDEAARLAVWRRRVAAFVQEAEAAKSKIMRAMRLQQALERAEASTNPQLRREAAAALQTVRNDDLEMMSFSASSHRYEEESERLVEDVIRGDDWQHALVRFATYPPLSGDTEANRAVVREQHRLGPLAAILPTQLLGADGLPVYSGISEEDRFDVDLVRWEIELIEQWLRVMATALHEIPRRHGLPSLDEISAFLAQWPAVEGQIDHALARSLLRYWTGDSEGAAYTITPRIESLARSLVLRTEQRGIYRLQREKAPGQYVGLGQLLPMIQEEYGLEESRARFFSALLRHPAGFNLRNLLLHGFVDGELNPGIAAVLIYAALNVAVISPHNEHEEEVGAAK